MIAFAKGATTIYDGMSLEDVIADKNEDAGIRVLHHVGCILGFAMEGHTKLNAYTRKKLDEESYDFENLKVPIIC